MICGIYEIMLLVMFVCLYVCLVMSENEGGVMFGHKAIILQTLHLKWILDFFFGFNVFVNIRFILCLHNLSFNADWLMKF